jgi:hypothetical protein
MTRQKSKRFEQFYLTMQNKTANTARAMTALKDD